MRPVEVDRSSSVRRMFGQIDALLRGAFAKRTGGVATADGPSAAGLATAVLVLGASYGIFMGLYGAVRPHHPAVAQLCVTMAKVPLLFFLTLCVTLPSLYVFSALHDSKLKLGDTFGLALSATTVNLAVLASFGPVVAFFTLSSDSYRFLVVLNVALFAVSGLIGVSYLRRRLDDLYGDAPSANAAASPPEPARAAAMPAPPPTALPTPPAMPSSASSSSSTTLTPSATSSPAALSPEMSAYVGRPSPSPAEIQATYRYVPRPPTPAERARTVFRVWTVVFAVVGAQMSWILRPFIGSPDGPFELFRERRSHFFEAFFRTLGNLFR
jgi:hypothetical protein